MKLLSWSVLLLALVAGVAVAFVADEKKDDFVPMFNGKDLTGWVNVNCAPSTFFVRDGEIITTGKPTGYLRTTKQYENFIAEFDWMHIPPKPGAVGNSGFFVWADPIPAVGSGYTRGIEVQVLVNLTYTDKKTGAVTASSHGDLFSIWGATCVPDRPHPTRAARCIPSENRAKGEREWNHYRVEANDGVIKLAVNGKVVSGVSKCSPRKGYLALESEGSECHFRNLKIKELPTTNPKPEEIADQDRGFKSMYDGLDLSGWKVDDSAKASWQAKDTVLRYDGKADPKTNALKSAKTWSDAEFIIDFRFPKKDPKPCTFVLRESGNTEGGVKLRVSADGTVEFNAGDHGGKFNFKGLQESGKWNRLHVTLQDITFEPKINGKRLTTMKSAPVAPRGTFVLRPEGEMDFANPFVREGGK